MALLGNVTIPTISPSMTPFPIKSDLGYGTARAPQVAIHTFGDADAKTEQRFFLGDGVREFTVKRGRMSQAERAALETFWISNQGIYGAFPYDAPNPDGTTTRHTCHFKDQTLTIDHLARAISTVGIILVGAAASPPAYAVTKTVLRFPDTPLAAALLSQEQTIIPILTIAPRVAGYPVLYMSDRDMSISSTVWSGNTVLWPDPTTFHARLVDWSGIQQVIGASDTASFTLGNADRVMSAIKNQVYLMNAVVSFCLLHVDSSTLIQLWRGLLKKWHVDSSELFKLDASDGIYDTSLMYPPRDIDRLCWKVFKQGAGFPCTWTSGLDTGDFPSASAATCDKGFGTPNGCLAHINADEFGGIDAQSQTVYLKDNSSGVFGIGRGIITSVSSISDTAYGQGLPEVYANVTAADPSVGFPVQATIAEGRLEGSSASKDSFYDALGIVSAGPIGAFAQQVNSNGGATPHTLDNFPPHGWPQSNYGLRFSLGNDPNSDPFSLGEGGGGIQTYSNERAAGVAFVELRRKWGANENLTALSDHTLLTSVRQGMSGFTWTAPGSRTLTTALTNPVWVMVNAWLRAQNLQYASTSVQESTFDVVYNAATADVCDLTVPALIGAGTETQFTFTGRIGDRRALRDWLSDIAINANLYYTFVFGKLRIGIRENSSALDAFNSGNILFKSLEVAPSQPRFNHLTATFADFEFNFQSNSVVVKDEDHAKLYGLSLSPQYVKNSVNLPGCSSKSQAGRVCVTLLREEIGGAGANGPAEWTAKSEIAFKSTVLGMSVEPGAVYSMGDADTMLDLPDYPATDPANPDTHAAQANFMEFRATGWTLNKDYSITVSGTSTHRDMYQFDFGPKPTDIGASTPTQEDLTPTDFAFDVSTDFQGNVSLSSLAVGSGGRAVNQATISLFYSDEINSQPSWVSGTILVGDTSIPYHGHAPQLGQWLLIDSEFMLVTSVTPVGPLNGDCTVLRAQFGTTAVAHAAINTTVSSASSWLCEFTIATGLSMVRPGDLLSVGNPNLHPLAEYNSASGLVRITTPAALTPVGSVTIHPRIWVLDKQDVVIPLVPGFFSSGNRSSFQFSVPLPYASVLLATGTVTNTKDLTSPATIRNLSDARVRTLGPETGFRFNVDQVPAGTSAGLFTDAIVGNPQAFDSLYATVTPSAIIGNPIETPRSVSIILPQGFGSTGNITLSGTVDETAVIAVSFTGSNLLTARTWDAASNSITGANTLADVAVSLTGWLNNDPGFLQYYRATFSGAVVNVIDIVGVGGTLVADVAGAITAAATGISSALGVTTGRRYAISFYDSTDPYESSLSPLSASTGPTGGAAQVAILDLPVSADTRVDKIRVYATPNGQSSPFYKVAEVANVTGAQAFDTITESTLASQPAYGGPSQPPFAGPITLTVLADGELWAQVQIPGAGTTSNTIPGLVLGPVSAGVDLNVTVDNASGASTNLDVLLTSRGSLSTMQANATVLAGLITPTN